MSLACLIAHGGLFELARAKSAIPATVKAAGNASVAEIARLAIAAHLQTNSEDGFAERSAIAQHEGGISAEWCDAFAILQTMPVPPNVEAHAWPTVINDAGRFLDRWSVQASALGWTCADVFGLHQALSYEPMQCAGLVSLIGGWNITEITTETAAIKSPHGLTMAFFKRPGLEHQPAVWECLP